MANFWPRWRVGRGPTGVGRVGVVGGGREAPGDGPLGQGAEAGGHFDVDEELTEL